MSDNNKNETADISKDKFAIKEGDIVWHTADKCICEVLSLRQTLPSKPIIYIVRITGDASYGYDVLLNEIELILPKEQIQYEMIISGNTVKAFYKGKMVLDIACTSKVFHNVCYYAKSIVKRNYIYEQLLEMYPGTKINKAIDNCCY